MDILLYRKSTTKIKWYSGYGGWKMKADIAGSILLAVLKKLLILHFAKPRVYRANRVDIATDDEPQPFVMMKNALKN